MQRRGFVGGALAGAVLAPTITLPAAATRTPFDAVDSYVASLAHTHAIPCASLAIAKDGRLVHARAFGFADLLKTRPATTGDSFRIASSSKPITAVAIMRLIESGRLRFDDRAFALLADLKPPTGSTPDPRLHTITIRHLLEHTAGFDSTKTDIQFEGLRTAARALDEPAPASASALVRYMQGQPLAFDPGTKYVYSNFGYNTLGRIIERVSGRSYADFVAQEILEPAGIHGMRLGRTRPAHRLRSEVVYWDNPIEAQGYSVYADDATPRPYSYGGFSMEAIDAHGGWVARPIDLTRFLNAVGGRHGTQLLKPQTIRDMLARPNLPAYRGKAKFYANGWDVTTGKIVMSHSGALTWGTASVIARLPGEITYAICFNRLPYEFVPFFVGLGRDSAAAIARITDWPEHDLYAHDAAS